MPDITVRTRRQEWGDIDSNKEWKTIQKITKGWSADQKYKILTKQGEVLLLRLADIDKYDEKKKEFDIITKYSEIGIPMSMPIEFYYENDRGTDWRKI